MLPYSFKVKKMEKPKNAYAIKGQFQRPTHF